MAGTTYADITFNDPNPIKRWLQHARLRSAVRLMPTAVQTVCDFGAGNGELCKLLTAPGRDVVCFEPGPQRMIQAHDNLRGYAVRFTDDAATVADRSIDVLFCLEVLEHLPAEETLGCIRHIKRILRPSGTAIIGVPRETGVAAVYKGLFRMARRAGDYDAKLWHIGRSAAGFPPGNRPVKVMPAGSRYHPTHMGFSHHRSVKLLRKHFGYVSVRAWPMSPEVNIVLRTPYL
jgi:SAM-dependent methyltransferase